MSEQKFYKYGDLKPFDATTSQGYIEATPEDFKKAGYVKREKVNMKLKKYEFWALCECGSSLHHTFKYCSVCGSKLIWKE